MNASDVHSPVEAAYRLNLPIAVSSLIPRFACLLCMGGLLLWSVNTLAQQSGSDQFVDSSIERIVSTVEGDTFPMLGVKVFGSVGMGRLLAEYNDMDFDTVFESGIEIIVPTHLQPKKNFATVSYVKGGSSLHVAGSNQEIRKLEAGQRIYTTDVIATDNSGFVSVTLSNGSVVNVQPDSRALLAELACMPRDTDCTFSLDSESGSVSADVRTRRGQKNRFLIKTPYASAAVRGTVFDFDANSESMNVGVTEGEVAVLAGSDDLSLPTGFGSKTQPGSAPGEPVQLLKQPDFESPLPRIGEQDKIAWTSLSGARSYQLAVSQDSEGTQEIYREKTDLTVHDVRQLPVGEAYVSVRGVDSNDLKGFRATHKMNIVSIDQALPRPELEKSVEGDSVFVKVTEQNELIHELQFSQSEDFATVVTVDVPADGGAVQQLDNGQDLYVRGRVVVDNSTVGAYGPVILVQSDQ